VLAATPGLLFVLSFARLLYANYQVADSAPWQLIISGILLSIPLALLYFSIGVLVLAARQSSPVWDRQQSLRLLGGLRKRSVVTGILWSITSKRLGAIAAA
jgi:hypothetical protein